MLRGQTEVSAQKKGLCHSIFARSLARFTFRHPRGINFVYASRDHWLQNSPITNVVLSFRTYVRNL